LSAQKWMVLQYIYRKLDQNSDLLSLSPILNDFYTTIVR